MDFFMKDVGFYTDTSLLSGFAPVINGCLVLKNSQTPQKGFLHLIDTYKKKGRVSNWLIKYL